MVTESSLVPPGLDIEGLLFTIFLLYCYIIVLFIILLYYYTIVLLYYIIICLVLFIITVFIGVQYSLNTWAFINRFSRLTSHSSLLTPYSSLSLAFSLSLSLALALALFPSLLSTNIRIQLVIQDEINSCIALLLFSVHLNPSQSPYSFVIIPFLNLINVLLYSIEYLICLQLTTYLRYNINKTILSTCF